MGTTQPIRKQGRDSRLSGCTIGHPSKPPQLLFNCDGIKHSTKNPSDLLRLKVGQRLQFQTS